MRDGERDGAVEADECGTMMMLIMLINSWLEPSACLFSLCLSVCPPEGCCAASLSGANVYLDALGWRLSVAFKFLLIYAECLHLPRRQHLKPLIKFISSSFYTPHPFSRSMSLFLQCLAALVDVQLAGSSFRKLPEVARSLLR